MHNGAVAATGKFRFSEYAHLNRKRHSQDY